MDKKKLIVTVVMFGILIVGAVAVWQATSAYGKMDNVSKLILYLAFAGIAIAIINKINIINENAPRTGLESEVQQCRLSGFKRGYRLIVNNQYMGLVVGITDADSYKFILAARPLPFPIVNKFASLTNNFHLTVHHDITIKEDEMNKLLLFDCDRIYTDFSGRNNCINTDEQRASIANESYYKDQIGFYKEGLDALQEMFLTLAMGNQDNMMEMIKNAEIRGLRQLEMD